MSEDQQDRPKRHIRIWLALALVAVLVALVVVPPYFNIARYKSRIAQLVSTSLRRPVRLSSVELRALPRPGFVLTDLTVDEDPSYGSEPVLHANTVTTSIRLSSLWRGHIEISRISVDEASLNLVHTADGRWNVDSLFRTAASLPATSRNSAAPLPYMEATNSRINVKDGMEKLPYSLVNADASLWQESGGVWRARVRAQPVRTDVNLDMGDTGLVRIEVTLHPGPQLEQMPLHIDLDWREAQLGQLSRLLLGSDEGWRGDLTGEFHLDGTAAEARVKSRLRASGVHRAEFAPAAPLDFDAACSFSFRSSDRAVRNLLCDSPIGEGRARLTGDVPGRSQPPHLTLELARVPAQAGLDVLRTLRTNVAPGLQAAGAVSGKMSYQPVKAEVAPAPAPRHRGTPAHPPAGPLTGSFTVTGLRISGDTLSVPIQVAKLAIEPAASVPGDSAAVTTSASIPSGGRTPLTISARLALHRFQVSVHGMAAVPRLRELVRAAGIPHADAFDQLTGEPATVDVAAEGPWLAVGVPASSGPDAAPPVFPLAPAASSGTMAGTITFHSANWKSGFLANPVALSSATLRIENGAFGWESAAFAYGPVQGTASLSLPENCEQPQPCPARVTLQFDTLDLELVQSALLGARERGTMLSTLLDRLKPNSSPSWPPAEAEVRAGLLTVGPFNLRDVVAAVRVKPAEAEITSLDADAFGGRVHAAASLTPGDKPAYKVDVEFQKLNPALMAQLLSVHAVGGTVEGDAHLELSGYTEKDLTSTARGTLHFDWKRGSVANLGGPPAPSALTHFDRFSGDAAIAGGLLLLGQNEVQHGSRTSSVQATVSFGTPAQVTFTAPAAQRASR